MVNRLISIDTVTGRLAPLAETEVIRLATTVTAPLTPLSSAAWNAALARRSDRPVTVVTFTDSRGDGTKVVGGVGASATQVYPQEFANQMRAQLGLGVGGRGYLPMKRTGPDNTYDYAGPSLVSGQWAPVDGDTGVPNSQWIIPVAEGGRTIRIPLLPGTTSVDLISSAPGGGVHYVQMTGQSGAVYQNSATQPGGTVTDLVQFTKLTAPGTYVDITSPGGGWAALGVIEYAGDEAQGVRPINFATAGISAVDFATGVAKATFAALLAKLNGDMTLVALGGNDAAQGKLPPAVVTAVKALLTAGRGVPLVLVGPVPPTGFTGLAAINTELRKITPARIIDLAALGADSDAAAFGGWFQTDKIHLTPVGNRAFGDAVQRAVFGAGASNATPYVAPSLAGYQLRTEKGQANGYVPLDSTAKIAAVYLPSYVDDVLEFANLAAFPATGESGKIYVTLDTNWEYRWGGSTYVRIVASPGSTSEIPEGTNLYYTQARADARAAAALAARSILAGTGLSGGGALSADRTLAVTYGTSAGTAAQGNDSRLSDTRTPTDSTVTIAKLASDVLARINPAQVTRSAAFCFEMCSQFVTAASASTGYHQRRPFRLAIKPTRFRIRFRNRVQLTATAATGTTAPIQNLTVVIGKPAVDATTGDWNGNWTAAPLSVQTATTIAAGGEVVTGWVDAATYALDPDVVNMIGYSFQSAAVANGQVAVNGGLSFQNATPSDLTVVAPSTALTRADNNAYLQVIIEYEHTDRNAVQLLVAGNSLSGPSANSGATPQPITNHGEMGNWHQKWAQSRRCIASSIAVAGSYAAHFGAAIGGDRWDIFDGFNIPYVPDAIVFFAASSSDIADTTTASGATDVKNNVRNMVRKARSKFASVTRILLTNIPPRINFTGSNATNTTNEYYRYEHNVWLDNTLPMQVERVLDVDSLVSDFANPARMKLGLTTEGVHFTGRAHDLIANAVPITRSVP